MIIVGDWAFDPSSRRLLAGCEERRLSPKAAGVLQALAETPHQVWSRDALLERVWPNVVVGEEVLTHAIAELRRALGDDFREPVYVETISKRGYRLICGAVAVAAVDGEPVPGIDLHRYATYLEACERFERGGSANTHRALELFARLTRDSPEYAPAQVGAAKAMAFLRIYYSPRMVDLDLAMRHCIAARRSDPRSAEADAVEGFIHAIGGDYPAAKLRFGRAVGLAPGSSEVHYLFGRACFAELDVALAAPMLERAAALRGDDYHSLMLAGKARQMAGDEVRARGDFVQAAARIEPRLAVFPDDYRAICGLARCLVHLGRDAEAADLFGRAQDHNDPMNYHLACTFARAGETNRALDTLEAVVDHGWKHARWLERDPDFDGLRHDRRFQRIARTIAAH